MNTVFFFRSRKVVLILLTIMTVTCFRIMLKPEHVKSPIRKLVFLALHKTGSTSMRQALYEYADTLNLSYWSERSCTAGGNRQWTERYLKCHRDTYQPGAFVEIWALTMTRVRNCCQVIKDQFNVPDAIISHFPLNVAENRKFYNEELTDHFSFTTIREPVDQFISFHHLYMNTNWNTPGHKIRPLSKMIDDYEKYANGDKSALNTGDAQTFELISNSQSKELGWDGRASSLPSLFSFVDSLSFVALTSNLADDMAYLRVKLNVNHTNLLQKAPHSNKNYNYNAGKIDQMMRDRIERIQWADRRLYSHVLMRRKQEHWKNKNLSVLGWLKSALNS